MKLEEITSKLENRSYTTKELTELNISRYTINKLMDASILTRTSRGVYECSVKPQQSKEAVAHFRRFVRRTFKRKYDEAYEALKENFLARTVNDYDHHLRIYFTLLNELTSEKHDLSFLSELKDGNIEINDNQDIIFNKFYTNLLNGNHGAAFSYLKDFKLKEEQSQGESTLSTKLFYNLLLGIVIKQREENNHKQQEIKPKEQPRKAETSYINLISKFDYYIENDMYQEAYNMIDEIIVRAHSKYRDNYIKIKKLLSTYFELKNNYTVLPELDIDYSGYTDYKYIFNVALANGDYLTALGNVGKLIYANPNSKILGQYRKLLFLISDLNKENKKRYKEPVKNIQPKSSVSIDDNELYDLVYDGEHEKLYALLSEYFKNKNNSNNRTYYNLFKLLKVLEDISLDRYKPFRNSEVLVDKRDSFKYFFEALHMKNYEAAYSVVDDCDTKNKANNNGNEFELYKYMLQDVLREIKRFEETQALMSKIKEYDDLIDTFIFQKGTLSNEDIVNFLSLLEDKKKFMIDNYMDLSDEEEKLVSLLRTIISFNGFYGELNEYFDRKEYTGSLVERLNASLEYGDYPSSLEIITNPDFTSKTKTDENKKYYIAYKKLLFTLKNNIKPSPIKREEQPVVEIEESTLSKIKSLIKRNDYISAYILYVESNLDETNPELKVYLDIILKYLVEYQREESLVYLNNYKEAYRRGDMDSALRYLDQYKESIQNTGLNRELDYHYNRISREQQLMDNPNFVQIENLYDRAKYYLEEKMYDSCIKTLDEYLALDNSPRAYLLRGRAYEFLRDFEQARINYEAACSLSKEPNALYRLGKLALYRSDYDGAYAYLKDYQMRRPYLNYDAVRSLVECEEKIGSVKDSKHMKVYRALNTKKS